MNLLPALSTPLMKLGAIFLFALTCSAFVGYQVHKHDLVKYEQLAAEYNQFKGGVAAIGRAANERNAKQALADLKSKERADEENVRTSTRLRADIKRLRDDNDRARGDRLPDSPAGSKCPEGQVCYDREELQRADRERRAAIRKLADEGTEIETDLNTARQWAQEK